MVKYVEEYILCARFTGKKLDIINNENVYNLIKMDEIVPIVLFNGIDILLGEFFRRNVQNRFFWILIFNINTNSVCQMCFAKSNATKNKKRIERRTARFCGNR